MDGAVAYFRRCAWRTFSAEGRDARRSEWIGAGRTLKGFDLQGDWHCDGHREAAYHNAMVVALNEARLPCEAEPYVAVVDSQGNAVRGAVPDLIVADRLIVELKAHTYTMTGWEQAQVLSDFAALPDCPVALFLNFGHDRLEYRRLFPTKDTQAWQAGQRRTKS